MTSPIETIADALIAFILSLLRDPDAAEEFASSPQPMLAQNGLGDVCMADVASVRPVIVDHPHVVHNHYDPPSQDPAPALLSGGGAVQEIVRMIQQYTTIDARSTLVDQSVNQNIWTEGGDVTQLFDQEAVLASGDHAVAAGHDVALVDSDVDVSMGDVAIGNEEYTGSFNTTGDSATGAEAPAENDIDVTIPAGAAVVGEGAAPDPAPAAEEAVAEPAEPAPADPAPAEPAPAAPAAPADVPEPADLLEGDMTSGSSDAYEADASTMVDDQPIEAPLDDD